MPKQQKQQEIENYVIQDICLAQDINEADKRSIGQGGFGEVYKMKINLMN
jgi:hypothetical protein